MHSAVRRNALCNKEKCVSRGLQDSKEKLYYLSPYYLAIPLKRISPYCRVHFSLLQNAFLLTAECISPYCIRSLKDPAHHIPNQTEIATEEFCPKSLLRKQNEIDFIESHFQIQLSSLNKNFRPGTVRGPTKGLHVKQPPTEDLV